MPTASEPGAEGDRDITQLLREGEVSRAFAALLPRYEQKIYRLCVALLRDRTQSEDAAQESLVRIWKNLHRYDGRAALSTWIYTVTRNRCLTALEQRRSRDRRELGMSVDAIEAGAQIGRSEYRDERLRALVAALPERLRRVLLLYYFEERSVEEVARMLGCPEGTVKTQLFRARGPGQPIAGARSTRCARLARGALMNSQDLNPDLQRALDAALARALPAPNLPEGFHVRLQRALSQSVQLSGLREQLEQEQRQQLAQLRAGYVRLRQRTLGALIGGAFAAGAAAALAMPWLLMRFGTNGPMILAAVGAVVGLAVGFAVWAARPGVPMRQLPADPGMTHKGLA
jgi:RNA polymerase sigma-70 factor (ECF subfamily)